MNIEAAHPSNKKIQAAILITALDVFKNPTPCPINPPSMST
jgi:hypothetical protein